MTRGKHSLRVEFSQREGRASNFDHFAEARISMIQFRGDTCEIRMQEHAKESTRLELLRDNSFVVPGLCGFVPVANRFARDTVGSFEVIRDFSSERTSIARRVGQGRAEVHRHPHFSAEHESVRRETGRFTHCRSICLKHIWQQRFPIIRRSLHGASQH